jgi:hypothetical protein
LDLFTVGKRPGGIPTPTKYDYNDYNDRKSHFAKEQPVTRPTTTRHGKNAVVVVSAQEWERKTRRKGSLAEFFENSPLRNSGLVIERNQDPPRKIDL